MNRTQRITLLVYIPMTLLILLLDHLYPDNDIVNYVKYATMLSLFLLATFLKKTYSEQKALHLALSFVILADFFFVFCDTIPHLKNQVLPLGIMSFSWAYLILIMVYQKNFCLGWGEILVAALVLVISLPYYSHLENYVQGFKFYSLSLFGIILIYMSWSAMSTLFRGYYSCKISLWLALSGFFILLSDLGVGLAITHPHYLSIFDPWLENLIWGFYIPAWALILLVIAEEKLYR